MREAEPACPCHGAPMQWKKDRRNKSGGNWVCAVLRLEESRERRSYFEDYYFEHMPFKVRAKRGLYQRRYVALKRRRDRQLRGA